MNALEEGEDGTVFVWINKDPVINPSVVEFVSRHIKMVGFSGENFDFNRLTYEHSPFPMAVSGEEIEISSHTINYHTLFPSVWEKFKSRKPIQYYHLSEKDYEWGRTIEKKLGIPHDAPLVTFHMRENSFVQNYVRGGTSFDGHTHRNNNLEDLLPSIDLLLREGFWVVRIGDPTVTPMPSRERVIDLAMMPEMVFSFADIWFCTRATFMLSSASGPATIPSVVEPRRPLLLFNIGNYYLLHCLPTHPQDRFIPKMIYSHKKKRNLTYREIFYLGVDKCSIRQHFDQYDLTPLATPAEVIYHATQEMIDLVKYNRMYVSPLQLAYQKVIHEVGEMREMIGLFEGTHAYSVMASTAFLESYPEFLS